MDMNRTDLRSVIDILSAYIEQEHFKGWDPYDYLNSWFPFHWFGKIVQAVAVQAGKLIPVNLRPLLGIEKEEIPKGLGLLLSTFCLMYKQYEEQKYLDVAKYLLERLIATRSENPYFCWGCNFVWANPKHAHQKYYPSLVVTSFVGFGIYDYYKITGDNRAKEILLSISTYIHKELLWTKTDAGLCISYTKHDTSLCYNASILGAAMLARVYSLTKEDHLLDEIKKLMSFVISHQHEDGHWNYALDPETGKEYSQVDFHQGFILCALDDILSLCSINSIESKNAIVKGLDYYRRVQFKENGISLWRIPKEYPVEIHNQSQGIITFARLSSYDARYMAFSNTIASWTIHHMKSKKGFFYYRKYKWYTIKIPYMRWSQAWMMLALSILMSKSREQ